ncbi:MAG: hypothetical protein DME10_10780 [Candidatus Rokuibacteriota bacterium]|nr:MAG: hypothetical protein DME10_10780 [Candidatus Rokubacteria bacterium]
MGLLDGKVAVVTGGGTGIGRAVSLGLAAAGARVVVNDYGVSVDGSQPSSEPANQVVSEIISKGGKALASPESVATMAGGRGVVEMALRELGGLDIVVCCAGILRERMIFNMTEEEWDAVVAVHLKGHFTVMRPATAHMREKKAGSIVTFTSTAGLEGSPGQPNYSAAKEGIVGLMRSTALAMAKYGVRCNAISPTADTRMTQRLPSERRGMATATPPEAIAPVVTFLASDRAAHITARGVVGSNARPGPVAAPRRHGDSLAARRQGAARMTYECLIYEVKDRVATLTLNRPERLNALGGTLRDDLFDAVTRASADPEVRVMVITGAGKGFCAGGDVKAMSEAKAGARERPLIEKIAPGRDRTLLAMREAPQPIIAAVNGAAAGAGMNLALGCDLRIASTEARFAQAFVKRGLHPDWGGTYFLPRVVGMAKACEMIFTGDLIDAAEALRLGLVSQVVPPEELLPTAHELARRIAAGPPVAIRLAKQSLYANADLDLQGALHMETMAQNICFETEDATEGIRAFVEKRAPVFRGR